MCPEPGNKKATIKPENAKRLSRCVVQLIWMVVIGETSGPSDIDADLTAVVYQ